MRAIGLGAVLIVGAACEPPEKDVLGDIPAADLCALSRMAWSATWAETESPEHPLTYEDLAVHVEPVGVGDGALDLAVCLSGEVTWRAFGASGTTTLEAAALDGKVESLTGGGYLTADDGLLPCVGLTAGLAGDLATGATFTEESYWWETGDDRERVGEGANGWLAADGSVLTLEFPAELADGLGISASPDLAATDESHWVDPVCIEVE